MRKLTALAALALVVSAVSADAANVTFSIREVGGDNTAEVPGAGGAVNFEIVADIDSDSTDNDGLALVGVDLTFSSAAVVGHVSGGAMSNPGGVMSAFNYPDGVTNPPFPPGSYGGTNNGTSLLQIGGGQNTIGNPGPTPPFPVGAVNEEVAVTAQVVATGTYNVPSGSSPTTYVLTLANCFANTIDNGEVGPSVFNVSAATTTCGAALTISYSGISGTLSSAVARKTCDINIDMTPGGAITSDPRQGTPGGRGISNVVFAYTGGDPANNSITIQEDASCPSPPTFGAYTGTSVPSCTIGLGVLDCTFTPNLENARTYRFTVASGAVTAQVELRGLVGDVSGDGNVNATDRSLVVSQWTAPGYSCATDAATDINVSGATDATDRSLVVAQWTGVGTNCAP